MKEHSELEPFSVLSDATRRQILLALAKGRRPAGEIAALFPQQRPAISKHLSILKRTGFIRETRDRQRRLYSVNPQAFDPILALVGRLRAVTAAPPPPKLPAPRPSPRPAPPVKLVPKPSTFEMELD